MKTFRFLKTIIGFSMILFAVSALADGGIPVIDSSNLAQQIQQVMAWSNQLRAMNDQYQQLNAQYQALTGNRGYGSILNNPAYRLYMPNTVTSTQLQQQYGNFNPCQVLVDPQRIQYCQNLQAVPYQNVNQINQAIAVSDQRGAQIQGLIAAINQTNDPKAIAELQARIQGEQAAMANDKIRIELTLRNLEIQNQMIKEQQSHAAGASDDAIRAAIRKKAGLD